MKTFYLLIIFLVLGTFSIDLPAQVKNNEKTKSYSLHIIKGYKISTDRFTDDHSSSNLGLEAQISFHKAQRWGIQIRAGWMKWADSRETYIPLVIGPEFVFPLSDKIELTIYGNAGPAGLIGNDYASIFGTAEAGIQFAAPSKKGIIIGLAWSQNTIFHPSHFSFIKGSAGWRF